MSDAIAEALADLEAARAACVAALAEPHVLAIDKVRAAAELRLIARERLTLLDRQAEQEAERRDRADAGLWSG